jgi:hypothetical protein
LRPAIRLKSFLKKPVMRQGSPRDDQHRDPSP